MLTKTLTDHSIPRRLNGDCLGMTASALCAIHCIAAPVLLLLLPSFGSIWAHPASHWGMVILVIPLAIATTIHAYQKHGKKWVLTCASIGVLLVLLGSALPYLEVGKDISNGLSFTLPGADTQAVPSQGASTCVDSCCPSVAEVGGKTALHIPPAGIVTTLGGIALIAAHFGNICACRSCKGSTA